MTAFGSDITIVVGGEDFSTQIDTFDESGGVRQFKFIKTFGNNYKSLETGRTDYEVKLNFRVDTQQVGSLFDYNEEKTIVLTNGGEQTVTYYQMKPKELKYVPAVEGLTTAELTYSSPAYDKDNTRYNRVLS